MALLSFNYAVAYRPSVKILEKLAVFHLSHYWLLNFIEITIEIVNSRAYNSLCN